MRLSHASLGYDPYNTMSVGIPVHQNSHVSWEERAQYFSQLRAQVANIPGVVGAGVSTNATPPSNGWDTYFEIFGRPSNERQEFANQLRQPEYFEVLHIPLLQGRL